MGWLRHRHCPRWITLHFAGELDAGCEKRMRHHLRQCGDCRALYDLQLLSEDGDDVARASRLEHSLFQAPERPRLRRAVLSWSAGAALAALALMIVLPRLIGDSEYRVKGAGGQDGSRFVNVSVYSRADDGKLRPVRKAVASGAPIAFAYSNRSRQRYDRLLLFGVDDTEQVYWFYPAWTDPSQNPAAEPIRARGEGIELPDEVTHDYDGSRLRLFALFTRRRDLTVQGVEEIVRRLKRKGVSVHRMGRFPLERTGQQTMVFDVGRQGADNQGERQP